VAVALVVLGACTSAATPDDPDPGTEPGAATGVDAGDTEGSGGASDPGDTSGEAEDVDPPAAASELPPPPATSIPATREPLRAWLEATVADARAASDTLQLGVLVVDEAGREVVAFDPDRPLLPASTLKQVTAAAALTTLGAATQLRTVVDATAGIDESGVLDGDLLVVGSGDPTLVTEEYARFVYPARPRTSLDALADQLVGLGITRVTGSVHGTAPAFAAPSLPAGWRDAYLDSLDGRYVAGLTVDGGLVTDIRLPEIEDDDAEDAEDDEAEDDAAEDAEDDEAEDDGAPVNILDQLAALASDVPPTVRTSLAPDPVLHVASELTRMLRERGVEVVGEPVAQVPERPVAARLGAVTSPPLAEVLRFTVQRSDNHLADALAVVTARARTRDGSWAAVPRAYGQVLERFDVPTEGAVFADGSGLSRDDRLTARLLTELDRQMTGSARFGGAWRSFQAVAGRSGTLDGRLRGTPAEGRLLGKTGTLRDVAALTGQVIAADADPEGAARPDERRYHITVLGNEADGVGRGVTRALVDEIALALVADLDGCELAPLGDVDGPLGRPPTEVRCDAA
jgi:serine-type D-Ala-D-Ala carboxypeptidase/endopeptidase (penicillin-binding protein 4)